MTKVSVLIASRGNEPFLTRTIENLLEASQGEVEILVGLDGSSNSEDPPDVRTIPALPMDPRVKAFSWAYAGLKPTINRLASEAQGDFFLKTDAHCAFSEGWDVKLAETCPDNWIIFPRFYVLKAEEWRWQDERFYDYFMLDCPLTDRKGYRFKAGGHWPQRTAERLQVGPLDESMSLHGSAWFLTRHHFLKNLGGMQSEGYGNMFMEPADLGNRTWCGPWAGQVMVRKDVWYAHMHKGKERPRGFGVSMTEANRSYLWTANYWMREAYPLATRSFGWLVDKFMPMPGWPTNWRELQARYAATHPWAVTA